MKYTPEELALLDMFAGQALAGIVALRKDGSRYEDCALDAYNLAEAMLEERKKFIE